MPPLDEASTMQVIVHGGAGGEPDEPEPRQEVLDEAAENGAAAGGPDVAMAMGPGFSAEFVLLEGA